MQTRGQTCQRGADFCVYDLAVHRPGPTMAPGQPTLSVMVDAARGLDVPKALDGLSLTHLHS